MGPLPITKLESGSGFAPAMGINGAVHNYGSDLCDFVSDSEAM